jgi:peptidoglycan hydrolase-like protein with peptidoglycan-binding domain
MKKALAFGILSLTFIFAGNAAEAAVNPLNLTLSVGSEGETVVILQDFLRAEGLFTAQSTGYFGPITEAALRSYQSRNGLTPTGETDIATLVAMQADTASAEVAAKAAIERNPAQVPVGLNMTSTYLEGLDPEAEGTAAIVMQIKRAVDMLEMWLK